MCSSLLVYKSREVETKHCQPFSTFCLPPLLSASVPACWPGKWGLGRDAGLLMKLHWEPGVRQQRLQGLEALLLSWVGGTGAQEVQSGQGQATGPQPSGESTRQDNLLSASRIPNHITRSLKSSLVESTLLPCTATALLPSKHTQLMVNYN